MFFFQCFKSFNFNFSKVDWYIDSAAATHMTNGKNVYCTNIETKQVQIQAASCLLHDIKGIDGDFPKYWGTDNEVNI